MGTRSALPVCLHRAGSCRKRQCCPCWSYRSPRGGEARREKSYERTAGRQQWLPGCGTFWEWCGTAPSWPLQLWGSRTENTQRLNVSNHLIHCSVTVQRTARITPRPKNIRSGILYRKKTLSFIPQRCKSPKANIYTYRRAKCDKYPSVRGTISLNVKVENCQVAL